MREYKAPAVSGWRSRSSPKKSLQHLEIKKIYDALPASGWSGGSPPKSSGQDIHFMGNNSGIFTGNTAQHIVPGSGYDGASYSDYEEWFGALVGNTDQGITPGLRSPDARYTIYEKQFGNTGQDTGPGFGCADRPNGIWCAAVMRYYFPTYCACHIRGSPAGRLAMFQEKEKENES